MSRRVAAVAAALLCAGSAALTTTAAAETMHPATGAIAVIGDYGSGTSSERDVAALVARARPHAIVTTGDNVYDSDDYARLVGRYYGPWIQDGTFLPATGNHDYDEGISAFDRYFAYLHGVRIYSRIVDDVQFYVLDSDAALSSGRDLAWQRDWLARWVPRSTARWQVVVLHHPPFSSGSVHGSTPRLQWPYRSWGVDLVLSGHEHQYERIRRGGLTYVVDGAGGKDLYGFATPVRGSLVRVPEFGALFLTSGPDVLTGEFWTSDGRRVDRFAIAG